METSETPISLDSRSTELAKRMFELRSQKAALELEVNELDSQLDQVKAELTQIMQDLGVQKFGLNGIGTFYLATSIFPKILDNDQMIQWLDNNNRGDIAPRKIHSPSLREMMEGNLEKDLPIPPVTLVEMTTDVSVRLRLAKKGA